MICSPGRDARRVHGEQAAANRRAAVTYVVLARCESMLLWKRQGFVPFWAINDQGLVLGVLADGSWVVGGDSLPIGSARERTTLRSLLPLLERPFREVEAAVTERISGQPGPPWSELLTMALRWPTEHWADRALDWIEGGYVSDELSGVLDEARQLPIRSQRFRLTSADVMTFADKG